MHSTKANTSFRAITDNCAVKLFQRAAKPRALPATQRDRAADGGAFDRAVAFDVEDDLTGNPLEGTRRNSIQEGEG